MKPEQMHKQAIQVDTGPTTSTVGIKPNTEYITFDTEMRLPKNIAEVGRFPCSLFTEGEDPMHDKVMD